MFLDAVQDVNKVIIFCAVGAHHQNGISEFHIKFLLWARKLSFFMRGGTDMNQSLPCYGPLSCWIPQNATM